MGSLKDYMYKRASMSLGPDLPSGSSNSENVQGTTLKASSKASIPRPDINYMNQNMQNARGVAEKAKIKAENEAIKEQKRFGKIAGAAVGVMGTLIGKGLAHTQKGE